MAVVLKLRFLSPCSDAMGDWLRPCLSVALFSRRQVSLFSVSHSLPGALTASSLLDLNVPKLAASLVKALACVVAFSYRCSGMLKLILMLSCHLSPDLFLSVFLCKSIRKLSFYLTTPYRRTELLQTPIPMKLGHCIK